MLEDRRTESSSSSSQLSSAPLRFSCYRRAHGILNCVHISSSALMLCSQTQLLTRFTKTMTTGIMRGSVPINGSIDVVLRPNSTSNQAWSGATSDLHKLLLLCVELHVLPVPVRAFSKFFSVFPRSKNVLAAPLLWKSTTRRQAFLTEGRSPLNF